MAPGATKGEPEILALGSPDPKRLVDLIKASLDDDKGEEIVVIDLSQKSSIADYMVIANGRSARQVGAMAQHLLEKLKAVGVRGLAVEGLSACDWVLLDAGDVIIHIFRPEVRTFYNLDKMWGMAPTRTKVAGAN
jgi:ribosome-associated protein